MLLFAFLAHASESSPPVCVEFAPGATTVTVPGIPSKESSGLAAGRSDPDVYYTLDDGGNDAALYMFRLDGVFLGTQLIEDAVNTDWEDISPGPCPAAVDADDCLYIGDIGDNDESRDHATIWVVPESVEANAVAIGCDVAYPDGEAHDAEAMFVTPDGAVRILTKTTNGTTHVFGASGLSCFGDVQVLDEIAELNLESAATGAAMNRDGTSLVIRSDERGWMWTGCTLNLGAEPTPIDLPGEPFGESVTFSSDGLLVTSSEEADFKVRVWPCDTQDTFDCPSCGCGGGADAALVAPLVGVAAWLRRRKR